MRKTMPCGIACLIVLLANVVLCPPVFSQQVTLKLPHVMDTGHAYQTLGLKLAELVKSKSNGNLIINVYPNALLSQR
jgi:TRAP-type C4-dicarboxylate transport system substrate-binding protein